jgi:glycosyltransferase involved in cell wall biosynthesis
MHSILVLTSTYPRWKDDVEPAFVSQLCREIARAYRPIVLAPHYPGARRHEFLDGIEVYRFRYFLPSAEHLAYDGGIMNNLKRNPLKFLLVPFFLASQLYWILRLCRGRGVRLIHAHWLIPQGLLAVLARKLGCRRVKLLCTSHGGDLYSMKSGLMNRLKAWVLRHADHVTVVSNAMHRHLLETDRLPASISVQSMGVDLRGTFTPGAATRRDIDLLFVGRLVEKKGVATLLDAVALLGDGFPDLTLTCIGDGPERQALEQRAAGLGISQRVHFHGAVPNHEIPDYYRSARIAVVPSLVAGDGDQEGLGLVAVEALGCSSTTVVSDLPALQDVVEDRQNGMVFRAGDPADLADKLRQLLGDRALYDRLAGAARQSVTGKFDWQTVGNGYIETINRCLAAT